MKKTISILLALSLLLGSFCFAFAFDGYPDTAGTPYEKAVTALANAGVVSGYPDGTYQPAGNVTRAEAVKIFALAAADGNRISAAALEKAAGKLAFTDVEKSHWAAGYIGYGVENGILSGYPDGSFKPAGNVSYYEAIKIAAGLLDASVTGSGSSWYEPYEKYAKKEGLLEGQTYTDGNKAACRGDIALLAYQLMLAKAEQEKEQEDEPADKIPDGNLFGVVQEPVWMLDGKDQKVSGVNVLVGKAYAGDIPAKYDSKADDAITLLEEEDYLNGQLYVMRVVSGEIRSIAAADKADWVKHSEELTAGDLDANGFAVIDEAEDGLLALKDGDGVAYVSITDSPVIYLLEGEKGDWSYSLGKVGDIKDGALIRLYDVLNDKSDDANIIIIDKRK